MNLNELYRLICNLVRIGTVTDVDLAAEPPVARVSTGENTTDWIRWAAMRAGTAVTWWAPTPGEQVLLFAPCGDLENAVIMGSLYSDSAKPPDHGETSSVTKHPDGALVSYDPETGALAATGVKSATVEASESIAATAPEITCTATASITLDTPEVICTKKLSCATFEMKQGGKMTGNVEHSGGTFKSNGVQVDDHGHGGVERGGGWTDGTK
ncbi:phage baseplate assembly protein V [Serratia odorifera]|uniref:Phage-related baseplate assembly protein n=2 Tax=Serratia odorifera TaxID=618 RepID=D4DZ49_SEROD|nr:phage baseplate assembly protein V [Serratia odorifera]EFE97107.1 phage-related baseplate assembly protein [Serratia odorifera DSM 4582]PNK91673.1 phage baseplate assembly protein V [Serratia odorifera]RII72743.1 phage baseplate assembly protein V [Serratia odorifera]VDZ54884.1 Phage P2 baseplate assembly protein gpV [Serratia odorifera]